MVEYHYIVFIPDKPSISEKSLKKIIYDNLVLAQLWDDEFRIPWTRFPESLPDSLFHPLAIPTSDCFLPDFTEELDLCRELANLFGYEVYDKKIFIGHPEDDVEQVQKEDSRGEKEEEMQEATSDEVVGEREKEKE